MNWVFFFLILVLSACANPRRAVPELKEKWSADELSRVVSACERGDKDTNPPDIRVSKYCRCVYRAASRRWAYSEYLKNVREYEATLDKEVAPGCEARVMRGEES